MRHARFGLILAGIGALGLAAWAPGCLFAPDDCDDLLKCPGKGAGGSSTTGTTGGMGGAGGESSSTASSMSTATTSTGTGSLTCVTTADCTAPATVCGEPFCVFGGHCGWKLSQPDGKTSSQVYGDCHEIKCKNGQVLNEVNDSDVYDDANACTEDKCNNGVPTNMPLAAGDSCGTGSTICDGQGACVACVSNSDCADPAVCHENRCVPVSCFDGKQTAGNAETDTDCGGSTCQPCSDNMLCFKDSDCVSGVCKVPPGQVSFKCITASCSDQIKNGTETAKDCGGPNCVARCAVGEGCTVPGDCKSGVCTGGTCKAPSCTDGVKNSIETGVDCGANCPACPS